MICQSGLVSNMDNLHWLQYWTLLAICCILTLQNFSNNKAAVKNNLLFVYCNSLSCFGKWCQEIGDYARVWTKVLQALLPTIGLELYSQRWEFFTFWVIKILSIITLIPNKNKLNISYIIMYWVQIHRLWLMEIL